MKPLGARNRGLPLPDRFAALVDKRGDHECWPFLGTIRPEGYGQFSVEGRLHGAHRVALVLATGSPIPAGLFVDHLCHNTDPSCAGGPCDHRRCCNLAHLEAVTHSINVRRSRNAGSDELRTCGVDGCDRAYLASGMCRIHYDRSWKQARRQKVSG